MSRPFSAYNVPSGGRRELAHTRSAGDRELTEKEQYARLRREVLDFEELTFAEQQEPPDDWAR